MAFDICRPVQWPLISHSTVDYEVETGRLLVEHAYPRDAVPTPRAYVDVNLVLETLTQNLLQRGAWLNVMGYVKDGQSSTNRKRQHPTVIENECEMLVQAILVWDAAPIDARVYEKTIEMQRQARKDTRNLHRG